MSVRDFTDQTGTRWKAWEITPESIHPQTRAEDYLVDCFQLGWLVFESGAGDRKRRLCPYPQRWAEGTDGDLINLLGRAEEVPPLKLHAQRQTTDQTQDDRSITVASAGEVSQPDITDLHVVRTFRYPSGRFWTVCVIVHPDDGRPARLRFTAGMRSIDLWSWPRDWPDYPDERLIELLREGAPRLTTSAPGPDTPRRRWDDPPAPARA
jgi:hypothetical protein